MIRSGLPGDFSSLFTYCCEVLRLSEPAAYNRIEAARAARRFPVILPVLAEGSLSLATVRLLASNFTAENQQELLAATLGSARGGARLDPAPACCTRNRSAGAGATASRESTGSGSL